MTGFFEQLTVEQSWRSQAACRPELRPEGVSPAAWTAQFFPERGNRISPALAICDQCDVRAECRAYAESTPYQHREGIWGGTTGRQRRRARATGRVTKTYTDAEKAEAVRLWREGVPVAEIARRVGAHHRTVDNWIDKARIGAA